jgi:hypothetical protein
MPTVGDLYRVRERPLGRYRVAPASISGDYANLWLVSQPRFRARWLSIRQQRNCPSSFEVTNKRPVAMIAFPGPIVDADYCRRRELRCAPASHYPKQSVCREPSWLENMELCDRKAIKVENIDPGEFSR